MSEPNLRLLKRSTTKPVRGDVFALSPVDGLFLFGRVIRSDLPRGLAPMPGAYLIYIYRGRSTEMQPQRSELRRSELLLAPLFINRMPWTKGYFQTVVNWPVSDEDLVAQHCFLSAGRGRYYDENFEELPGPFEPCGDWALHSYRTFDDELAEALKIPKAPI